MILWRAFTAVSVEQSSAVVLSVRLGGFVYIGECQNVTFGLAESRN